MGAVAAKAARAVAPARKAFSGLPLKWRVLVIASASSLGLAATAVTALLVYYTIVIPDPLELRQRERAPIIRILARDGSLVAERGTAHDYMPLELVPRIMTDAVVATEDRRFWSHYGVDPSGLLRAAFANMRAGRFAQGGSTLTQQLAKNLFLTPKRTMARKVEEFVLALWLELRLSKAEILELYLNQVYFGGGAYGIEAAAQRYFDKSVRELSLAEAAVIAGLLKAPSRFSPASNPALALNRGRSVLAKMCAASFITAEQARDASMQKVQFSAARLASGRSSSDYAVDFVLESLPPLLGPGHAELIVDTTIDPQMQMITSDAVTRELAQSGAALDAGQAAFVLLDTDGGIRALIGGKSYAESQFNRATKARRQPGSAFKPFVYLAALEKGYTPDSVAYDLPLNVGGWAPRNDSGRYAGAVTLRQALSQSINTVAVRLILDVGPARVIGLAQRLGIASDLRAEPSLALGTSEVSLLELTGAYGTFATGGRGVEPHIIRRVRMSSGRIVYARPAPSANQLAAPDAVGNLNRMLAETLLTGTGRRAALADRPAAGKTGTSQEFRDAWFVGYTANFIGGVWVGNDNGSTMARVTGGNLPARIWRSVMTAAHAGKPPLDLPGIGPGIAADEPDTADASGDEPSGRSELLTWQTGRQFSRRSFGGKVFEGERAPEDLIKVPASPPPPLKPPAYPKEAINLDFISRAIKESGAAAIAPGDIARPSGDGTLRFAPRPPAGMMSLGVPPTD